MTSSDYDSVCDDMRLADGTLWPMPITLDLSEEAAEGLVAGSSLALRDPEGVMLAALQVEDMWRPDLSAEGDKVFGTTNSEHPGVAYLLEQSGPVYVDGRIEGMQLTSSLRFPGLEGNAPAAPRGLRTARLEEGGSLPDSEPHAPGPSGAHLARG